MDDFMEKLLQEVSQETNNINMGQPMQPQPQPQGAPRYPAGNPMSSQPQAQPRGNMSVNQMQNTQSMPNLQQYGIPQPQGAQNIPTQMPQQSIPQPQPIPQHIQATPQQTPPVMQAQNIRPNMPPNTGYSQGGIGTGRPISFEDVSYLPDANKPNGARTLPGAEELAMEARKTEAYDERFRNNNMGAQGSAAPASAPVGDLNKEKLMEDVQSIVHTEVVKCYKNTEAAINDASRNVTESFEKVSSPKRIYQVIIGLLILNIILGIILVLHNFLGVI